MKNTLETRLGIFFALCIIVAILILEMVGVAEYFKPGYRVYADFKNVAELKQGDLVRVAGVDVGRVDDIALTNQLVRVTMKIRKRDAGIRTDSKATIRFAGLMGQNFISIDFGTANSPQAQDGAVLTTIEGKDLQTLMSKLEDVADEVKTLSKDLGSKNLAPMFAPITGLFGTSSNDIVTTLSNLRKASDQLANGQGTLGKLLYDESLYNSAVATVTGAQAGVLEFKSLATDARNMLSEVNAGKGTIGLLLKDDALYREATNTMLNVREIMEKVNRGQGTVGKLINDDSFLKNAKVSLQKLDKATEGLEDQGPLSVLGIAVNSLF